MKASILFKRLIFFWATSFLLGTLLFFILKMFGFDAFGATFMMPQYHNAHPIPYILLACFFYGLLATRLTRRFSKRSLGGQVLMTLLIVLLTVLISSPFGGMLYYYHDMEAGYFLPNWPSILLQKGAFEGIQLGWLIAAISIPFNIIGIVVTFFLNLRGSQLR